MNSTLYGVGWQGSRDKLAANWDGISSVTGLEPFGITRVCPLKVIQARLGHADVRMTWYIECVPAEELRGAETASRVVQQLLKQSVCGVKSLEMSSQMPS